MSRYQIIERVASGGTASIWAARDQRLGRDVAVKRLHEHLLDDDAARARFALEAAAAASISHPNVVTVLDAGEDADGPFLVMDLVRGETLRDLLVREAPFPAERALDIGRQLAAALAAAHDQGITHRDIKPENVLVEAGTGRVVLTDFGIASSANRVDRVTREGSVMGTIDYMAPERTVGGEGGPAADVYSLAVVLYELLTGRTPFRGGNPVAVALAHLSDPPPPPSRYAAVPAAVENVVLRGLAKEPERRYPDAGLMLAALEAAAAPSATTAELAAVQRGWVGARRWAHRFTTQRTSRAAAASYAVAGSMSTYLALQLVG